MHVISSETNPVVRTRCLKLGVDCVNGVDNKTAVINNLCDRYGYSPERLVYVGNDLNDLGAFNLCGHTICPQDSHNTIIQKADTVLMTNGGDGVFREILESVFGIDVSCQYLGE